MRQLLVPLFVFSVAGALGGCTTTTSTATSSNTSTSLPPPPTSSSEANPHSGIQVTGANVRLCGQFNARGGLAWKEIQQRIQTNNPEQGLTPSEVTRWTVALEQLSSVGTLPVGSSDETLINSASPEISQSITSLTSKARESIPHLQEGLLPDIAFPLHDAIEACYSAGLGPAWAAS